jgi:hypothetical protein
VNRPPAPRGRLGLALGVILVLATGGAAAEGRSLLFWAPYAPGSAEQAAGTMDAFARYIETAAGWPTGTMSAAYDNSVEGGRGAVEAGRPGFVVVPTPVYLNHAARFQWAPIKFLVTEDADAQRYSLYGPPGSTLASLAGGTLAGDAAYDEPFVRGFILGPGAAELDIELQPTNRPLSAVRRALRGEKVMVLLDEGQRRALASLPGGEDLVLLAESVWMPAGILAAGPMASPDDIAAVAAALEGARDDPRAEELLRTMRIRRFDPATPDELDALRRSYLEASAVGPAGDGAEPRTDTAKGEGP